MNQKFRVILSNIVNGGHPRLLETLSLGNSSGGLENGSAVKSTFCSWGRPEFGSQNPAQDSSQLPVTPVLVDLMLLTLWALALRCRNLNEQYTQLHIINSKINPF